MTGFWNGTGVLDRTLDFWRAAGPQGCLLWWKYEIWRIPGIWQKTKRSKMQARRQWWEETSGWERIHIKLDFMRSVHAERFARAHVHYRCVVFGPCAGTAERGPLQECLHTCPFLACASMCIIVCIFYGWCAAVCAGCCAHPCELPGVSGSRPSSLLCSPRSVLLASLSSLVLLLCAQLSFCSFLNLFYSTDKGITSHKRL